MRTVFKFRKVGAARYISHLDLMRTMNRAIRRAGLPAAYSQGFHPHIVMAYAQALGLGYLSEGEYMEISLDDGYDLNQAVAVLNGALPEGIRMTGAWPLSKEFPTLMAAVSAALWRVEFTEPNDKTLLEKFINLLSRDTIDVVKEGRNGPAHADIRKGIYTIEGVDGGVELFLAAGSALNIRPELVASAALGSAAAVKSITRMELYTLVDDRHLPFYKICIGGELHERGKDDIG
jgi:radical SAM-linked protein